MGTNTKPKPNQLGRARPSRTSAQVEALSSQDVWEWTGDLLDIDEFAFAGRLHELELGTALGPLRRNGSVLLAVRNQIVGRLPDEPAAAVIDALVRERVVAARVVNTQPGASIITVRVRVPL